MIKRRSKAFYSMVIECVQAETNRSMISDIDRSMIFVLVALDRMRYHCEDIRIYLKMSSEEKITVT